MRKAIVGTATAVMLATSFTGTALGATHEVKSGDSLWKIASQYNTSVSQLKDWNDLKNDLIYPKQVLFVTPDEVKNEQVNKPMTKEPAKSTAGKTQTSPAAVAKTYVVKSGDNLFNIAIKHKISLVNLIEWNNLKTDLIHPGQVLKVSNSKATTIKPPAGNTTQNKDSNTSTKPEQKPTTNNAATYTVVKGDTLSGIAVKYNTTVKEIKSLNGLNSDLIIVGQVLKLKGTAATPKKEQTAQTPNTNPKPEVSSNATNVINTAKKALGTKYTWGGTTLAGGFDCSGFIYYAFNQSGQKISRLSTDGYYDRSYYVDNPQPGDLVFFRNTYRSGISHMGIYLGDGNFIHANDKGVNITNLSNSYWKSKFDGFKKFY